MEKKALIEISNGSIGYDRPIQENLNLLFNEGQLYALIGRNGRGKTTLLKTLVGFIPQIEGEILINGSQIGEISNVDLSKQVAMVLTGRDFDTNLYVKDVLALGRTPYLGLTFKLSSADYRVINRVVEESKIEHFLNRKLSDLSDGERQKVLLARALVQETDIIILDEPTAHLDNPNRHELFAFLKRLCHEQNKTIILSTHEIDLADQYVDESVELT